MRAEHTEARPLSVASLYTYPYQPPELVMVEITEDMVMEVV